MISATIIADSINTASPNRERITTLKVTFPRFILAELNTHRMFSRNSASSRAIPFKKMAQSVLDNPFVPLAWQKDHSGMQGTEYHRSGTPDMEDCWLRARDAAVAHATEENQRGATKQLCNRLLEPFMWHTALITATEFENFFALRCPQYESIDTAGENAGKTFRSRYDWMKAHPGANVMQFDEISWLSINKGGAEIHISLLAEAIWDALNESTPKELKAGEWHIPFGDQLDERELEELWLTHSDEDIENEDHTVLKLKIATARCAQTTYTLMDDHDKPLDYAKLIALHERLATSGHWSPFEHCAQAMNSVEYWEAETRFSPVGHGSKTNGWCGNFRGWIQYRKQFPNENHTAK